MKEFLDLSPQADCCIYFKPSCGELSPMWRAFKAREQDVKENNWYYDEVKEHYDISLYL